MITRTAKKYKKELHNPPLKLLSLLNIIFFRLLQTNLLQLLYWATSCFLMESSHQHPLEKNPKLVDNPGSANTLPNGRMWNREAEQVFAFLVFVYFFTLFLSLQVLIYNKTRFAMLSWENLYCFSKVSKGKQYKCLNTYKSAEHKAATGLHRH